MFRPSACGIADEEQERSLSSSSDSVESSESEAENISRWPIDDEDITEVAVELGTL